MTATELYHATSFSWVASFKKTKTRDLKYYCAVVENEIFEVYDFLGFEEEIPKRDTPRFFLKGNITTSELRDKLIGLNVGDIHKGRGNPIKYTKLETLINLKEEGGVSVIKEEPVELLKDIDLVSHIHSYIASKGFNYSLSNIKNLYLSIRSKPFVIISGVSGTGKTKIAQLFAESVGATEENGQFKLIPVRPDWSDGSELLGYTDLKNEFQKGPLTEMVEKATDKSDLPYFILLDEMNLARVEYYLSDVLSVMESRKRDGERITTSSLLDEKYTGRTLRLPENLYILGTVNMDETTHPFSKKVLDRANTIEFNEIYLNNFGFLELQEDIEALKVPNEQLVSEYISLKDVYETYKPLIERVSSELAEINNLLEPMGLHVGYRVRDEICFYMIHNEQSRLLEEHEALDFCLMQKILPRITGSDSRIDKLLNELFEYLTGVPYKDTNVFVSKKHPRSGNKVAEMLRRYHADGFTSFWIS